MEIKIINDALKINIYGFEGIAPNKDYAGIAFKLSGKMWATVKEKELKNKVKIFGFTKTMKKSLQA